MSLGRGYDRFLARRDLVAGLTVAAISLPQGMAYALIAGVDPKYGVYSAIVERRWLRSSVRPRI